MNIMQPLTLESNRVWRVYPDGMLLDRFQGREVCRDGLFPEEWIDSTTKPLHEGNHHVPDEGLSRCLLPDRTRTLVKFILVDEPVGFLGLNPIENGRSCLVPASVADIDYRAEVETPGIFETHPPHAET